MKRLFYDVETSLLRFWGFKMGQQFVSHNQLDSKHSRYKIICLTYCWEGSKKPVTLMWDYETQDDSELIKEFDKVAQEADVIIGKNSDRFDNKHINTRRMFLDLAGNTEWLKRTDDLEKHMRKQFYLPSQSLDYISQQLGFGGKDKMSFDDWVHISTKDKEHGMKAFNKMLKYNRKDVLDTMAIWNYCEKHFVPKLNLSKTNDGIGCRRCGGLNIIKNGKGQSGNVIYQRYHCTDCNGSAGVRSVLGKIERLS